MCAQCAVETELKLIMEEWKKGTNVFTPRKPDWKGLMSLYHISTFSKIRTEAFSVSGHELRSFNGCGTRRKLVDRGNPSVKRRDEQAFSKSSRKFHNSLELPIIGWEGAHCCTSCGSFSVPVPVLLTAWSPWVTAVVPHCELVESNPHLQTVYF